jgi:hypothetical protein
MIAALIFAISIMTLLQFFVSYSRSLIAEAQGHELSEQAREICGLSENGVTVGQFKRLQQLIALCPDPGGDGFEVRAIAVYFRMVCLVHTVLSWAIPSAAPWIEAERGGCAYAAAVVLDRRIAYNRMLMAQQANH